MCWCRTNRWRSPGVSSLNERDLTRTMPGYYQTSKVVETINGSDAAELQRLDERFDAVLRQFFVSTADFSLERWEKELGLEVNNNYDIEYRRNRIISKMRGSGTVTVRLIKSVAESFANAESEIIEHFSEYRFTVKFVGTIGIPPNMDDLRAALEDCKPAHLNFDFEYTYNTHADLARFTHAELARWTHHELREGNLT